MSNLDARYRNLLFFKSYLNTARIQQAYYQEARNPSDNATLVDLAADIGLDAERFEACLESHETELRLQEEIRFSRSIGVDSFPSLVVESRGNLRHVQVNYIDLDTMLRDISGVS